MYGLNQVASIVAVESPINPYGFAIDASGRLWVSGNAGAGFLGVVSGFYFTICVITDATYRAEFFTEVVAEVRQSLAVRTVYLALVGGSGAEGRLGE